ncbi:MAG TPA: sulfur carrier protein ThiS adenylyltransferase ThiF [Candidatus Hydrogenedentes bacterium]|nr:sulfur carrier protein ThiS adenylyltransferase ThiF [Candidatus Hydrogenedentota bacterium]
MKLIVNEREVEVADSEGITAGGIRNRFKPGADLIIVDGFPVTPETPLRDGQLVSLIRRGETPSSEELEFLMMARHTPGVHRKAKEAVVGIAGLGGLGSQVAIALARVGVGTLILVDFDVVEPSNLNRQQYFIDQIGMPKTQALRDTLGRINPLVRVISHQVKLTPENIPNIFGGAQILVEAFDRPDQKAMLAEIWLRCYPGRPLVCASGLAGHEDANLIRTRRVGPIVLVGDGTNEARQGKGLMAPRVGVAAHHQANAVLRLILGENAISAAS